MWGVHRKVGGFRVLPALLAACLLALAAASFALPRLLETLLVHKLESAGFSNVSVELASVGFSRSSLRSLRANYRDPDETRAGIALRDVTVSYSLPNLRSSRIEIGHAAVDSTQGSGERKQPWPILAWGVLPVSELAIHDLQLVLRLRGRAPIELGAALQARQHADGVIYASIRGDAGEIALKLAPGRVAHASLDWTPEADASRRTALTIVYDPSSNSADTTAVGPELSVKGSLPLAIASQLLMRFQEQPGRLGAQGRAEIDATLPLGREFGTFESVDAALVLDAVQLSWDSGHERFTAEGSGPLAFGLRQAQTGPVFAVMLQRGLRWKFASDGGTRWQVAGHQSQPFRVATDGERASGLLKLAVRSPFGHADVKADRIRLSKTDRGLSAAAHLGISARPSDFIQRGVSLQQMTLRGDADISWQAGEISSDHAGDKGWLKALRGDIRLDFSVGRLAYAGEGEWKQLRASARLKLARQRLMGEGVISAAARELLRLTLAQQLPDGCGNLSLSLDRPLAELARIVQPLPRTLSSLSLRQGSAQVQLAARGCIADPLRWQIAAKLKLRDASLGWEQASAQGVALDLDLQRAEPLAARLQLEMARARIAAGAEIEGVELAASLDGKRLDLRQLHARIFGGELRADPQVIELPPAQPSLELKVSDIDLSSLLAVAAVDGLTGSGSLAGRLPISWSALGPELRGGKLNSQEAGILRYQPAGALPENPGLLALRNFHYDQLELLLDYSAQGPYALRVRLDGSNPEQYGGHPIRFSLDVNGELPGLLGAALLSGDFDRYLVEKLRRGELKQTEPGGHQTTEEAQ